jgi:hypothetical protein
MRAGILRLLPGKSMMPPWLGNCIYLNYWLSLLLKTNDDYSHSPPKQASTFLEKYSQVLHNLFLDKQIAVKNKLVYSKKCAPDVSAPEPGSLIIP